MSPILRTRLTHKGKDNIRKKEEKKMKDYVLHFIQTYNLVDKNISSFWRCPADNYNHAVEQLRDEIERNQGERLVLVEYYKS
jgi:hypothetical protein